MNTRLAAVASLDEQRPAGPVYRSIIAVDLEGSTARTNLVKGELRRVMYELLGRALDAVAITGNRLDQLTDRGDGVLVLIRAHDDVPKTVLLGRLIPLLTALLAEHNAQAAQPALRIRLRAVLHAGEVHLDGRGCYGEAIDIAIRLLDAPSVKRALKQAQAPLVLVISDEIYSGIVWHGYVDANAYLPMVRVRVANRRHRGWVQVPGPVASPVVAGPAPGYWSGDAARSSALVVAGEPVQHPIAAIIGRAGGVTRAGPMAGWATWFTSAVSRRAS
jgi:hypothetical protein